MNKYVPFKQWRAEQAENLGISVSSFNNRLYGQKGQRSRVRMPKLRRINARVIFVIVPAPEPAPTDYEI